MGKPLPLSHVYMAGAVNAHLASSLPACSAEFQCLSLNKNCGVDESLGFHYSSQGQHPKCQNVLVHDLIAQCHRNRGLLRIGTHFVLHSQGGAETAWCCSLRPVQLTVLVLCRVLLRALSDCHHHSYRAAEDQAAASDCHARHAGLCRPHPPAEAGAVQGGADRCRHCSHTTVLETAAASAAVRLQRLALSGSSSGASK